MPRVDNLGKNVNYWYEHEGNGNGSSTWDVCCDCYSDLESDPHYYDEELQPYNGDPSGDEGRGDSVEHPPYDDCDDYRCEVCGKVLTGEDD